MKTLKISSLLLLCLVLLFSCKKDTSLQPGQNSQPTASQYSINGFVSGNGNGNGIGTQTAATSSPTMTVIFNPDPAIVNQPVMVTGRLTPAADETAPGCGKLQLEIWDGLNFIPYGTQVEITSSNKEVSAAFTPTQSGTNVYQFRVHYIKAGCSGFENTFSNEFSLTVINPCSFGLAGSVIEAMPAEAGMYQFTINYTLNTCNLVFDKLKTQGGLTNGTDLISTNGGTNHVPGSSTNQVIKWEENTPGVNILNGTKIYTIVFKKAYSGTGAITLTGNWSASASWNGISVGNAEFPAIVYQP
jgi:hypothetical protein